LDYNFNAVSYLFGPLLAYYQSFVAQVMSHHHLTATTTSMFTCSQGLLGGAALRFNRTPAQGISREISGQKL